MKKINKQQLLIFLPLLVLGMIFMASDHIDSPSTIGNTADLADLYAYESPNNPDNTVFVANLQSTLPPGSNDRTFDEQVLVEFNIDNNNDLIEDLVIQAIPKDGYMYFFGPYKPLSTGVTGVISKENATFIEKVKISTDTTTVTATKDEISYFAGRREDPFYFDVSQYIAVFTGQSQEPGGGFKPPNHEYIPRELNVLSVIVEVPNKYLGDTFDHPIGNGAKVINTWLSTKRRQ
ncbi:DUF4331 family protein [Aquimarina sp. RZ0]|uniref:DUF4331 family protein n=1 Tax=Aquimarina sp. RZ0 TaxID=2607730 RepID=UPI00165F18A6|nr:DUF4331 family protein [Aquimarina sp. RZ0]